MEPSATCICVCLATQGDPCGRVTGRKKLQGLVNALTERRGLVLKGLHTAAAGRQQAGGRLLLLRPPPLLFCRAASQQFKSSCVCRWRLCACGQTAPMREHLRCRRPHRACMRVRTHDGAAERL